MDWFSAALTVAGLCLFETVTSVDNAIINAEVLATMGQRARRWFLFWGILIAVFLVRGLFLIFLFLHWLFQEDKNFGLLGEPFFRRHGVWFYAVVSVLLTVIVWFG